MGVVWIASYPKSGNTWVRFLLTNYLAGPVQRSADVAATIPSLHEPYDKARLDGAETVYCKTHYPWSVSHPHADRTLKAVVIVRHPKDVLLSNMDYDRLLSGREKDYTDAQFAGSFIAAGGDPRWVAMGYGSLEQNVASWLDAGAPEHILIKYEDMKADTLAQMRRIVAFLGLADDPERLHRAVKQSSFDQLRAMEVREKAAKKTTPVFSGAPPKPGAKPRFFINAGHSKHSLSHIDPALDKAFSQRFAGLMSRLGYTA